MLRITNRESKDRKFNYTHNFAEKWFSLAHLTLLGSDRSLNINKY